MLNTLRRRFLVSHLVPLLVIMPLMGIALVYGVETRVLLPNLSNELVGQARLVTEIGMDQGDLWRDSVAAQAFAERVSAHLTARLMLLDASGRLLASGDPVDATQIGQPLDHLDLSKALTGEPGVHVNYSPDMHAEVVDVFMPVTGSDGRVVGVVRLTRRLASVYELFIRLRYLIIAILFTGFLLGSAVGWVLALPGTTIEACHLGGLSTGERRIAGASG